MASLGPGDIPTAVIPGDTRDLNRRDFSSIELLFLKKYSNVSCNSNGKLLREIQSNCGSKFIESQDITSIFNVALVQLTMSLAFYDESSRSACSEKYLSY
jgi:hypothetical protein